MKRFIGKKELRTIVLYSIQHITRLEQAGKFPKRIRLGENRVAWDSDEIQAWMAQKLADRNSSS